jgi:uncharacterized paraquat-inducible protein A
MDEKDEKMGLGPHGFCFCPKCGYKKPHEAGIPCREERCPNCGVRLIREGSLHHEMLKRVDTADD